MAGAACAHELASAGLQVSVYEKSRGAGGRMATRRARFADDTGLEQWLHFDHGAPGFAGEHPAFIDAVSRAATHGLLSHWEAADAWVGRPDQPSWVRHLLAQAELHVQHTICGLKRENGPWFVECTEHPHEPMGPFDGVILAIPAIQAAALLAPIKADWAHQARSVPQQAIWTLMAARPKEPKHGQPGLDLIRPASGPLGLIVRQDGKPGRDHTAGMAAYEEWVAHARADWTLRHLEASADEVRATLLHALEKVIADESQSGAARGWVHSVAHRWRYAMVSPEPPNQGDADSWAERLFLWDPALALGVAGDAFAGQPLPHTGVQRAWLSGTALAAKVLDAMNRSA